MTAQSSPSANACPGCGCAVDPLRAPAVSVVGGTIAHFCSTECRERFLNRKKKIHADKVSLETEPAHPPKTSMPSDLSEPYPLPTSQEQTALLQSKLLRPQLIVTIVILCIAVVVLMLPPLLDGFLAPLVVAALVLWRLIWGIFRDRRTSWVRILEGAALPLAAAAVLVGTLFGAHAKLSAVATAVLLAMESMGRLFELIGRHRSGVLSAVEDNQQIALAASWKDNSEFAAKIKHFTMFLEWARYPIAVAVSMLTYFVTSGTFADSLLAFSTALVGVNPRILRMATGDSHLSTALIASKRGISVRDAHAVDALAHADVAIFIGKRSLLDQPKRVVDWKTLPEVNAQTLLDALLTVESNVEGAIATAVTDFAKSQNARADTTTEVTPIPGLGVIGATPWGRLIVGSRNLLLKNDVMTGRLEKEATSIEASGRRAIFVSLDDNLVAVFGIEETIVPEAAESITALKHLGIASGITTSAEVLAAESLANRIGIETVFFNAGEEKLERVLKSIDARGDNAVLIGHGSAFEEHLRAATAAIAIGNTEKTQAGFDTESRDVSLVPWLIGRARRANLSILVNLVFGTGVVLCSLGIAASWFSPAVVLLAGSAGAISAAITTFNAPYPLATKIIRQVTAPFAAIRNFTKSKMKRSI